MNRMVAALKGRIAVGLRARALWLMAGAIVPTLLVSACGPAVKAPSVDDSDYIFPDIEGGSVSERDEKVLRAAWTDVLIGQSARADTAMSKLLTARPSLRPAWVIKGFAALRAGRAMDAETTFLALVKAGPDDAVSLVGLAATLRRGGRFDEALPLYTKAQQLRPRDAALARRASEIKLAVAEAAIASASSLTAEGRKAEAIGMLQKALEVAPELVPVRLELADLLIEAGRRPEALAALAGAYEGDRSVALKLASLRFADGDLDGAESALRRGLRDPSEDAEGAALLLRIRERRAVLALPEPLRAIADAPRVTRAELAALVIVRIDALKGRRPAMAGEVASDLSRTWARPQIIRAIELGLMDVYPNHTFQPSGVIRRGELALVASRVLDLSGWGRAPASPPRDMSPSHLQYSAALRVMGAGVMQATPSGAFEPWRIVSGAEAKAVVDSLARLLSGR